MTNFFNFYLFGFLKKKKKLLPISRRHEMTSWILGVTIISCFPGKKVFCIMNTDIQSITKICKTCTDVVKFFLCAIMR